ncbi:MAG: glycosyltransferase [Bdellovibrionota bacterium]
MSGSEPLLILIDSRRGDASLLKRTLAAAPEQCGIWVQAEEPLLKSKRISRWLPDEGDVFLPVDLKNENEKSAIVIVRAGEVGFPKTGSMHTRRFRGLDSDEVKTWRGWAYVPRGHFTNWSSAKIRKFVRGFIEPNRVPESRTIPNEALTKPRILLVGHTDIQGPVGGVQLHVRDMIQWLDRDHLVFYVSPHAKGYLVRASHEAKSYESFVEFEWGQRDAMTNPRAEKAFDRLLKSVTPDVVHFHHLMGFPFSLVEVAKKRTRTVVSMHDFYAFCPRYDLIDERGEFCDFCGRETSCKAEDPGQRTIPFRGTAAARREKIRRTLKGVPKIVPSSNTKRLLVENLKLAADEIVVREYPIAEQHLETTAPKPKSRKKDQLTVGFIGAFTQKKGALYFERLVKAHAEANPKVKWKVFGEIGESDIALALEDEYDVEFIGSYARGQLKTLLRKHQVDIGLVLSIWPETYAMTVAEATAAGCIPVVTDVGAPPERVTSLGHGWVLDRATLEKDFGVVLETIKRFPETLERRQLKPSPGQFESRMQALLETVTGVAARDDRHPASRPRNPKVAVDSTSSPRI